MSAAGVLLLGGCLTGSPKAEQGSTTTGTDLPPLVLVMDSSGSMREEDGGTVRIDAARKAATELIESVPEGTPVSVIAYGTSTGTKSSEKAKGCQDVKTLAEMAPATADSKNSLKDAVAGLKPRGFTPIALALTKAGEQVPADQPANIVLISDGIETCAPPNPDRAAQDVIAKHPKASISTVGFHTDAKASKQLHQVAEAGNGLFVTAANPEQLVKRLKAIQEGTAHTQLTSTGLGRAQLGQSYDEVKGAEGDFPGWDAAKPFSGDLRGLSEDGKTLFVIVWQDCSYVFSEDKTLVAIDPEKAGTIDEVKPGDSYAQATKLYGDPVSTVANDDGTYTVIFPADNATESAYQMIVSADPAASADAAKITVIVLCRCSLAPDTIELTKDGIGDIPFGTPADEAEQKLIALLGKPDEAADEAACGIFPPPEGASARRLRWGNFGAQITNMTENGSSANLGPMVFDQWWIGTKSWTGGKFTVLDGVQPGVTWDDLIARGAQFTPDDGIGWAFADLDGVSFRGEAGSSAPDSVTAGNLVYCE